jgi:hypothetical protein
LQLFGAIRYLIMRFALFEFIASDDTGNSLSIGDSSWIVDLDEEWANNDSFDFNEDIQVEWPGDKHKRAEIFTARVHRFSGKLFIMFS